MHSQMSKSADDAGSRVPPQEQCAPEAPPYIECVGKKVAGELQCEQP